MVRNKFHSRANASGVFYTFPWSPDRNRWLSEPWSYRNLTRIWNRWSAPGPGYPPFRIPSRDPKRNIGFFPPGFHRILPPDTPGAWPARPPYSLDSKIRYQPDKHHLQVLHGT